MKVFLIGIVVLLLAGVVGYVGLSYYSGKQTSVVPQGRDSVPQTKTSVTKTGVLQVLKGDDYNYALLSEGKLIGVNSYTIKLGDYVGKMVQVTGQYSGTTLYADTVTIAP